METNALINEIKKRLTAKCDYINNNTQGGDALWTEQLKTELGNLGLEYGFKVAASTNDRLFENEWLYDLVWYKENEEGYLTYSPLVVECEWQRNIIRDIKYDFEKLLIAKSQLKLMICNCTENNLENYIQYFQKAINSCELISANEQFLIAILILVGVDADQFKYFELKKE